MFELTGMLVLAFVVAATPKTDDAPFTVVLGITQDAGAPQAGCSRDCCRERWADPNARRLVACLGIVDPVSDERWMIDATPDFPAQLRRLDEIQLANGSPGLTGILLTHAHIGHYTGLMFVGHESIGASGVPVYAMPRMRRFLSSNGPWDQLVRYKNVELRPLTEGSAVRLNERISVTPISVPHRDEYSEVVAFRIDGPDRSVLFLPDIDKWDRWSVPVEQVLARVDVAYIDGTFFDQAELPHRDMAAIPHPFIVESMKRFASLPPAERRKIRFIHLNHTNAALRPDSDARRRIREAGMGVAEPLERVTIGE